MQLIERHPAPGQPERFLISPLRDGPVSQLAQNAGKNSLQPLSLKELPFIKGRAVGQIEPRQKPAGVQVSRFFQQPPAGLAREARFRAGVEMSMLFSLTNQRLKPDRVYP